MVSRKDKGRVMSRVTNENEKWFEAYVKFTKIDLSEQKDGTLVWYSYNDDIHGPFTKDGDCIVNSSNVRLPPSMFSMFQIWIPTL